MKKNILDMFLEKVLVFPLWVKQIIYLRLYQNLAENLSEDFIRVNTNDIFQIYVPVLSFAGRTELIERKGGFEDNFYTFLSNADQGFNILDISMNNFWTIEEVAKYYVICCEHDFVKAPESPYIKAMAGFMAGTLRTGEYFKRIGKINVDQLEQIIIKQNEYAKAGTPKKMAEVMISSGLITEQDTHSLLILKEEAKKRFILDTSGIPVAKEVATPVKSDITPEQVAKIVDENKQLKEKLRKVLDFVKRNG